MNSENDAQTPSDQMSEKRNFIDYKDSFWFWILDRYGLPILLLFCIGWATARFAEWLRPKADQLFEKHIEIVDTAKALGQDSLEVQREVKNLMEKVVNDGGSVDRNVQEHMRITTELKGITTEIQRDVKDIHLAVVPKTPAPPRPSATRPK